jgi:hypothetical protein
MAVMVTVMAAVGASSSKVMIQVTMMSFQCQRRDALRWLPPSQAPRFSM